MRPSWDVKTPYDLGKEVGGESAGENDIVSQLKKKISEMSLPEDAYNTATRYVSEASGAYLKSQLIQALLAAGILSRK